ISQMEALTGTHWMIYIIYQGKLCDIPHSTSSRRDNELSAQPHGDSEAEGRKGRPSELLCAIFALRTAGFTGTSTAKRNSSSRRLERASRNSPAKCVQRLSMCRKAAN